MSPAVIPNVIFASFASALRTVDDRHARAVIDTYAMPIADAGYLRQCRGVTKASQKDDQP
jgi:hypothetical protein